MRVVVITIAILLFIIVCGMCSIDDKMKHIIEKLEDIEDRLHGGVYD